MDFNITPRQAPQPWVLPPGKAQTFTPDTPGVLRIQSGRVWVTMNRSLQRLGRPARPALAEDDLFLDSTTPLPLRAGQAVVLEPWSVGHAADAIVAWEGEASGVGRQRWQQTVVQPAGEFARGLLHAGLAFARLLHGLIGYAALLNPSTLRCRATK